MTRETLEKESTMGQVKLNLGCGSYTPRGWINVDYALGARIVRIPFFRFINKKIRLFHLDWDDKILIHDLRRPFPFADCSVDIIYTSHTLEHFEKKEGEEFLRQCLRVLRPGGILRVVVPDLEYIISEYNSGKIAADVFVDKLDVAYKTSEMGAIKTLLANYIRFPHKCMYDTKTLLEKLRKIGFIAESRDAFSSDISDIEKIESEGRTKNAVIVEGKRIQ